MKFKIFISSVQNEFADERIRLASYIRHDAMLGRFFDVVIFEETPAYDQTAQQVYLQEVRESDIYIDRTIVVPNERGVAAAHDELPRLAVREAIVKNAKGFDYEGTPTKVLSAEYLAAICVHTGRTKDKLRVEMFLQSAMFDKVLAARQSWRVCMSCATSRSIPRCPARTSAPTREKVYTELQEKCNVFSRRYFYTLLTDFAPYLYVHDTCPIASEVASRVLTLPTYYDLALEDVRDIAQNVLEMVKA